MQCQLQVESISCQKVTHKGYYPALDRLIALTHHTLLLLFSRTSSSRIILMYSTVFGRWVPPFFVISSFCFVLMLAVLQSATFKPTHGIWSIMPIISPHRAVFFSNVQLTSDRCIAGSHGLWDAVRICNALRRISPPEEREEYHAPKHPWCMWR